MPSMSFAGGSVRVVLPESYDARQTPSGGRRSLPGEPGYAAETSKAALLESLAESGFEQIQSIDLAQTRARDLGDPPRSNRTASNRTASHRTVSLDVDLAAADDAVVLLERDGVYSWHLPVNPADRTRDLDPKPRTARFEIDLRPAPSTRPGRKPTAQRQRSRGILGTLIHGAVQAIVLKFAAPYAVGKVIDKLEESVRPGLLHLRGADVSTWEPFETLAELKLPTDRAVRILLFVHGTFSSTIGGFGALASVSFASGFLRTAISAYDAVIGFDHKTLSLDPRANAKDLLARLSTHHPDHEFVIDIITHSRGGLTTRSFVEYELPQSTWPATVDHIVFVAATNGGTHLADPGRWHDLIDLYTNLVTVGAGVLAALPGGAPVAAVVGGVIKGLGALVKYLVSYAGDQNGIPGLAAMMPDGDFIKAINETQPGQPAAGTSWHVVSSNFHVELFDDSHHPPEFPRELVVRLKEGFVDQLFKDDNDLVVDTAAMSAVDLPEGGGFVASSLAIPTNDVVYHSNYFSQLQVIEAIAGWLPLGPGAAPEEAAQAPVGEAPADQVAADEVAGDEAPVDELHATDAGAGDRELPMAELPTTDAGESDRELPMAEPPPHTTGAAQPPPTGVKPPGDRDLAPLDEPGRAPASLTDAHLAAEMPARPAVKAPFIVRVRLSRRTIAASVGTVSALLPVRIDQDRPASVHIVGKRNATVTAPDRDVFELPAGGGVSELTFEVTAERPGKVRIVVIVRQGSVPLGTIELEGVAVAASTTSQTATSTAGASTAGASTAGGDTASATTTLGLDAPELEGLPCLEVIETVHGDRVVYEYSLRLDQGGQVHRFDSPPLRDRAAFVRGLLGQVERLWVDVGDRPKRFLAEVQDLGASLFEQLFPQEMQAVLWDRRDDIADLLLYADEPYMPWELVHLKPPVGPRQQAPRFLAQHGLVRWQFTGFPPKALQARRGHVRSLIPDYIDPAYALTQTAAEGKFLSDRFGATPLPAQPNDVRKLLRSGDFDLLHFSGHGIADPVDIAEAKVLLRGRRRGNAILPQYLSATNVSENATWTRRDQSRPVVVLNACQVGRGGEQLSTLGGFAKAFLRSGVGAFVSSLWSIGDAPARAFVEAFYDELLAGEQVSVATVRARERARSAGDATWLAYAVYARPDATLTSSGASPDGASSATGAGSANGAASTTDSGSATAGSATGAGSASGEDGRGRAGTAPPGAGHRPASAHTGSTKGTTMTSPASKALCVGINEFAHLPMSSWLAGCVNDAHDIEAALRERGFTSGDITVLTDAQATKGAVMGTLTDMVDGARPGDRLVFTYSSHGTQVTDVSGDETVDGLDEAFACYDITAKGADWDPETVIIDDEFKALFGRIPAGVLLEVVMDTCHSGTGLRRITELQHDLLIGRRPRFIPPPSRRAVSRSIAVETARAAEPKQDRRGLAELSRSTRGAKWTRPVLYAACKPNQTAADAHFDGKANGAFTYLFLNALGQTPGATRADLLKAVINGLKEGNFEQRSTLEGMRKAKQVAFGELW
ncbi:MAG: caspase family protein [Micrococcales bacterium]|nr:caspase family protein [Micrococcales bacterium]